MSSASVAMGSSKDTRVGQFMRLYSPIFTGDKAEEDPQSFIDDMEKIFGVIHALKIEGVEFTNYKLKVWCTNSKSGIS